MPTAACAQRVKTFVLMLSVCLHVHNNVDLMIVVACANSVNSRLTGRDSPCSNVDGLIVNCLKSARHELDCGVMTGRLACLCTM
jgi:hypothetical protein